MSRKRDRSSSPDFTSSDQEEESSDYDSEMDERLFPSEPITKKYRTVDPNSLCGLPSEVLWKIVDRLPNWQAALLRTVSRHFAQTLPPRSRFPSSPADFVALTESLPFLTWWTQAHLSHRLFLTRSKIGRAPLVMWAASTGRVDVLQWYVDTFDDQLGDPETHVAEPAALHGQAAVLEWLRKRSDWEDYGTDIKKNLTKYACTSGNYATVDWAVHHGKPLTMKCFYVAIQHCRDTDFLTWLRDEKKCPMPSKLDLWQAAFDSAGPDGKVLRWLIAQHVTLSDPLFL